MISSMNIIDYMIDDMEKNDMISMYAIICYVCTMLSPLSMRLTPRKPLFRLLGSRFPKYRRSSWLNQKKSSTSTFVHVGLL